MGAFAFKLEREDGTPADPPTFRTPCRTDMPGFVATGLGIPPMMLPERKTVPDYRPPPRFARLENGQAAKRTGRKLRRPSGPRQQGPMTHTLKLEGLDGTPADTRLVQDHLARVEPRRSRLETAAASGLVLSAEWALRSGVVSLPRPGSGDDGVRKYGAVIGIIAAIGTLIVVLIVWGSNGSDADGSTCTEIPAGRVPPAIICPRNASPKNSKERDCARVSTLGDVTYWSCSD
jgi:hypothetical protein